MFSPVPARFLRRSTAGGAAPARVTRQQFSLLLVTLGVVVIGLALILFGPARGARENIGHLDTNLAASRTGIYKNLDVGRTSLAQLTGELQATEKSLVVAQQGLSIARDSEQLAKSTSANTEAVREQTSATLATVRQVLTALGPLEHLQGSLTSVVGQLQAGVALARSTLSVAQQTLATGQQTLAVATATLTTLRQSAAIQQQLLAVAQQTLEQTRQINAKFPGVPIFPTAPAAVATTRR